MNDWRKYGFVLLSAGVFVTGVLWYERKDMAVRAEDVAELRSAVIERMRWAYAFEGDTLSQPRAPVVPLYIRAQDIYDAILLPTREISLGGSQATFPYVTAPAVYWLHPDAVVKDGYIISECERQWELQEEPGAGEITLRNYVLSPPSNSVEHLRTTASVLAGSQVDWWSDSGVWSGDPWPGLARTNLPSARFWHGTNGIMSCTWGDEIWWRETTGVSNGIPRWGCELIPEFKISSVAGGGFEIVSDNLADALSRSNDVGTVSVRSIRPQESAIYASEIFSISRSGLEPAHFGATDRGGANTNSIFNVEHPRYVIPEGTARGPFWARPRIPTTNIVTFAIDKIWSSPSLSLYRLDQTDHLLFSIAGGNAGWYMRSEMDADRAHDLMLYSITALGEIHHCIVQQNDTTAAGPLPDMVVSPASDTFSMGAQKSFTVRLNRDLTSDPVLDMAVRRRNLDEARSVLTNLTRSVAFIPFSYLSSTNTVIRVWESSFTEWGDSEYGISTLWNKAAADLEELESTSYDEGSNVYELWEYIRIAEESVSIDSESDYPPDVRSHSSAHAHIKEYYGIKSPYPHAEAYSSGLVSRVQVYLVLTAGSAPGYFHLGTHSSWYDSYSGGLTGSLFAGELVENFTVLDLYPELPAGAGTVSRTSVPVFSFQQTYSSPKIKLISVCDEAIPKAPVCFDITADTAPNLPDSFISGSGVKNAGTYENRISERSAGLRVAVQGAVVVVDWQWEHMNPESRYVPELHSPQWADEEHQP